MSKNRDRIKIAIPENVGSITRFENIGDVFERAKDVLEQESNSVQLTKTEADEFSVMASFIEQGILGVTPKCDKTKCPFAPQCPLKDASHGKRCQMEITLVKSRFRKWAESIEGIDIKNGLHMSYINQLVSLDVQEFRLSMRMADLDRSGLTERVATLIDEDGNPYFETKIIPELTQVNKIANERLKILRELVATPREMYKKVAALKENDKANKAKKLGLIKDRVKELSNGQ